jgi:DNA-binding transcriptional MerR regulator
MTVRHLPLAADSDGHGPVAAPARRSAPGDSAALAAGAPNEGAEREGQSAGDGEARLLLVGDIARASGKTVRAIHHYEDVGLLRPHARSKGRYRLYDQAALHRVRWIGKLHDLGMSLSQIQELVSAWEAASSAPFAMTRIRDVYVQKLEETRAQIAHLKALERELVASVEYLDTCERCDPAELVAACSDCHVHPRHEAPPELVAGIHGGARPHAGAASGARGACCSGASPEAERPAIGEAGRD